MGKLPVLGNDPFLRGAAQRPEETPPQAPVPADEAPTVLRRAAEEKAPAPPPKKDSEKKPRAGKAAAAKAVPPAPKAAKPKKAKPTPKPKKAARPAPQPAPEPESVTPAVEETLEDVAAVDREVERELDEIARQAEAAPDEAPTVLRDAEEPHGWLGRAKQVASGLADQAMQGVLANPFAQRTLESIMGNPVTHKVAETAAKAVSATRPALDIALRILPPAASATRTAVSTVVSGEAARSIVATATEAGVALRTAARRSEPEAGEVDAFGEDPTLLSRAEPLLDFLHDRYFRLEALEPRRLPKGASLLVCNHSGVLPLDGPMVRTVLRRECKRLDGRWLVEDALFHAPVMGTLLNRLGGVRACPENAERLLSEDVPLVVFPEGLLGISKPVSRRYQLQRFGRGGFVKLALRTGVPIVPVAIVGAEEASPLLAKIPVKSIGFPYLPVTPTFPFLGPLGLLPFPTKWIVSFLEPVRLEGHGPGDAEDPALVNKVTAEVRDVLQRELDRLVAHRRSVLSG